MAMLRTVFKDVEKRITMRSKRTKVEDSKVDPRMRAKSDPRRTNESHTVPT